MAVNDAQKVIIIGAGIAGLVLANVLRQRGVPFQIYERDISQNVRPQGWSIGLHLALNSLRDALDPVKFATFGAAVAVDPQHPHSPFALVDGNAGERRAMIDASPKSNRIRTNRARLRNWLARDINVEWNKAFESYTITDDGVQVTFADGTTDLGRVLVGADGVSSRVCRQLIGPSAFEETTVTYPAQYLACSYWINQELRNEIQEKYSPAYMTAAANAPDDQENSYNFLVSLTDVDYSRENPYDTHWGISCKHDKRISSTNAQRLKQAKEWAQKAHVNGPLLRLIEETPESTTMVAFHLRERSPHKSLDNYCGPIALIGDAAHPVTQFTGEGGNHGILDAVLLGSLLDRVLNSEESLETAMSEYYKDMLPRGRKAVAQSHSAAELFHGPRANIAAMMNAVNAAQKQTQTQEQVKQD